MSAVLKGKRSDIYICMAILFYGFVVLGQFLSMHYVHDTYIISSKGYGVIVEQLYNQGRLISSGFYAMLSLANPPPYIVMYASVFLSILFLGASVYMVYRLAVEHNDEIPLNTRIFTLLGCVSVFFSLFISDALLFFENCVIFAGVFLAVLACRHFIGAKSERSRLWCFALLLLGVFCYQASVVYFVPIAVIFIARKHRESVRRVIVEYVKCGLYYGAACALNLAFIKLIATGDVRANGAVDLFENIRLCMAGVRDCFVNNLGFMTEYVYLIFTVVLFTYLAVTLLKKRPPAGAGPPSRDVFQFIAACLALLGLIAAVLVPHLFMSTDNWYMLPRSAMAMLSFIGFIMICIALSGKKINRAILAVGIIFVLLVSNKLLDMSKNNYAANKLDAHEVMLIAESIYNYERQSGKAVNHIYAGHDSYPLHFRDELTNYHDVTIRALSMQWMFFPLLNDYMDRQYKTGYLSREQIVEYFGDRNWDKLSFDQFIFEDDTLYLCIY